MRRVVWNVAAALLFRPFITPVFRKWRIMVLRMFGAPIVKNGLMKFFGMDDEERKAIGQRGYDLVCEKFTWDASAKKMIEVYEWLLGKSEKPDIVY